MGSRRTACQQAMSSTGLVIRPARTGEAAILTDLCMRSKAHWGYDPAFMDAARAALRIAEAEIGAGNVLVAQGGTLCGVASIVPLLQRGRFEIGHLFVAPECLRGGVGRALFKAAIALAARRGALHVSILSDPHAADFYEKLGARRCGEAPSDVIAGRMLPLFEFVISAQRSGAAPE
jgi:GNAT superfamily N-acetyltransferase